MNIPKSSKKVDVLTPPAHLRDIISKHFQQNHFVRPSITKSKPPGLQSNKKPMSNQLGIVPKKEKPVTLVRNEKLKFPTQTIKKLPEPKDAVIPLKKSKSLVTKKKVTTLNEILKKAGSRPATKQNSAKLINKPRLSQSLKPQRLKDATKNNDVPIKNVNLMQSFKPLQRKLSLMKDEQDKKNKAAVEVSKKGRAVAEYGVCLEKNEEFKETMEDFARIVECFNNNDKLALFAVFDGHGGDKIAKMAADLIPDILKKKLKLGTSTQNCLKSALLALDTYLKVPGNCGSTATVLLTEKTASGFLINCANLGDSQAVLVSKNEIKKLSELHKCSDEKEKERIIKHGGKVFQKRLFGTLVLSRALGDYDMKKYGLSAEASVITAEVESEGNWIVIGSDGLFDYVNDEDLQENLGGSDCKQAARRLVNLALDNGSPDNISCVVVKL